MWDINGKLALVTGAGSGIGRATALALAGAGARVIVCDVNEASLESIAAELGAACVMSWQVDVGNADAMRAIAHAVHAAHGPLDILINNAGVGISSSVLNTTLEDWDWVIGINLKGVIHGLHFFLPAMVERGGRGHVVNVASLAGYFVSTGLSAYLTTKFGVFGLSEVAREDLRGTGIGVSTVCPGIIRTNIVASSRYRGVADASAASAHIDQAYRKRNYGPEKVAAAIVRAIQKNRAIVPVSPESWLLYYLNRFNVPLSRLAGRTMVRSMMPK
jgi:NAD(P)-dependent dehydrogenase (short-subunit alcohol dehydrogenase family)